jgi:hypothetical protein
MRNRVLFQLIIMKCLKLDTYKEKKYTCLKVLEAENPNSIVPALTRAPWAASLLGGW